MEAKKKGYTEPDPREDLSGMDVARKILILSREIGLKLEFSDITISPIIPSSCESAPTVEAFFDELKIRMHTLRVWLIWHMQMAMY